MARIKRKSYAGDVYWGKPVSGFGDPRARLWILGLAPAAHGANRTGRIFTGDRSGDWLYRALYKADFANQPTSLTAEDGLELRDTWVSCVVRCAPPDNKPLPTEVRRCSTLLKREIALLGKVRVVVALGRIALDGIWPYLNESGKKPAFAHAASHRLNDGRLLVMSYHPSQQNTFTGRLTEPMFDRVFSAARTELARLRE